MGGMNFMEFIRMVLISTFNQLIWFPGWLIGFGLVLFLLARFTRITYRKSAGQNLDTFLTGWIGTPVHELGHAIFCVLFRHKILEINLYSPDSRDGTLGFVNHSYNPASIWQRIGNLFIGVGPIILGSFVLFLLFYFLVPNSKMIIDGLLLQRQDLTTGGASGSIVSDLRNITYLILTGLFQPSNFSDYRFWIFLYLAMSISSHMELSPADLSSAGSGFLSLVIFFLGINLLVYGLKAIGISQYPDSVWFDTNSCRSLFFNIQSTGFGLFLFASIISGINFLVSYLLLSVYNLFRNRGFINPLY
jgi:hypothetical protein